MVLRVCIICICIFTVLICIIANPFKTAFRKCLLHSIIMQSLAFWQQICHSSLSSVILGEFEALLSSNILQYRAHNGVHWNQGEETPYQSKKCETLREREREKKTRKINIKIRNGNGFFALLHILHINPILYICSIMLRDQSLLLLVLLVLLLL